MIAKSRLLIDGKPVRCFLFVRFIPSVNGKKYPALAQVEAFTKDHAWRRLQEIFPHVAPRAWDFVDELDPEHDVGKLGTKHPLNPLTVNGPETRQ